MEKFKNELDNKTELMNKPTKADELKLFYFYNEFIIKEYCLPISESFFGFLKEDSIILDEKALISIDQNTKLFLNYIIEQFESIFIKLNFSAASDCFFMINKLRITKIDEIFILIKSSSKLQENLFDEAYSVNQHNSPGNHIAAGKKSKNLNEKANKLFIKKWHKIDMKKEFRVLYYKNRFIIFQRYCDICFDYQASDLAEIYELIYDFFKNSFKYENFEISTKIHNIIINSDLTSQTKQYNNQEIKQSKQTQAQDLALKQETKVNMHKESLNYLDFHSIRQEDISSEIIYVDLLILKTNKIKLIDIITEKQRKELAFKLDDYSINNFLPLFFEKIKKSNEFNDFISSYASFPNYFLEQIDNPENISKVNEFYENFINNYFKDIKDIFGDANQGVEANTHYKKVNKIIFYVQNNDEIIDKDDNYNKFPQELIDNPANMMKFLEKLEIENNK